jgi:hypothetical protein
MQRPAGRNSGNSRNGSSPKAVHTKIEAGGPGHDARPGGHVRGRSSGRTIERLFRLRLHLISQRLGFACYPYSKDSDEDSLLPTGTPERALIAPPIATTPTRQPGYPDKLRARTTSLNPQKQ